MNHYIVHHYYKGMMGTVLQKYKYEFKSQNLIMYIDGSMPCKYSLESIEKVQ
jgi:hypothetical protein